MKNFIIKCLVNAAGIAIIANIVPGIDIQGYGPAVTAAVLLVLLNTFIKPIVVIITLPINILSLGLFTLFINTFVLYATSKLVKGFVISGFWTAFIGALCLSIISFILNVFVGPFTRIETRAGQPVRRNDGPSRKDAIDIEIVEQEDKEKKLLS